MLFGSTDMRYTLRQLEVFLAVAEQESVSRAAEALAMSQSAVSGALADLERQFDIQLFERVGKRLQLSELGRSIRARAEALHEQAREFENELSSNDAVGQLRVGATLTIGNYLMVPEIARFMREHPSARVTLDVANTAEIARKVLNFEIDIGLVEGELQEPELEVTRWRPDELVVFCAPGHPFATQQALSDADLVQGSWIVREPGLGHPPGVRARDAWHPAGSEDRARAAAHRGHQERGRSGPGRRLRLARRARGSLPARHASPMPSAAARLSSLVLLGVARTKVSERSGARISGSDPPRAALATVRLLGETPHLHYDSD